MANACAEAVAGAFRADGSKVNRDFILGWTLVYAGSGWRFRCLGRWIAGPSRVADWTDEGWQGADSAEPVDTTTETSGETLNGVFARLDAPGRLALLGRRVSGPIVFTTSFGLEDQALTHLVVQAGIGCRFVTLDTGRLFPQTHAVWAETEQRYGIRIEAFYPRPEALVSLVQKNGINGFYHSTDARHACCGVRKVEPLNRALRGGRGMVDRRAGGPVGSPRGYGVCFI